MSFINVGVIRGGPSNEHEVSIKTGGSVIKNIPVDKYKVYDIYIDKDGSWHLGGVPMEINDILEKIDVAWNALHGYYGEDGKIQQILERFGIPYTGSDALSSAIGMNKLLSKEFFIKNNIKTPRHIVIDSDSNDQDRILNIFRTFPMPAIVKPVSSGSSVGLFLVSDFDSMVKAVDEALKHDDKIMIEEYIKGKEATCGVVDEYRGSSVYALPPIEIRPYHGGLFDYDAKYSGKSEEICPGNFTEEEKKMIERMSIDAHKALGLRHYSRSDFIISPKRGIYILEVNTLPGLTEESLLPKGLKAIGSNLGHFIDHILELALKTKKR